MKALVTGGSKRIGGAISLYLAQRGYDVAVHFNSSAQEADELVAQINAGATRAVSLQADLLDHDHVDGLIDRASAALGGPLTVLVNNASIFESDTIETADRASWDRHIDSNLWAPFRLTQHFAEQAPDPDIDANGEPRARANVVNMIDQKVRKLTPGFSTYTIAKMGLWAFTQTAAQGLAPKVRVNGIGPGPTVIGERQSEESFAAQRAGTILQRGSSPDDITAAIGYVLDAPAVTGQLICVDGGQHLGWRTPDITGFD